MSSQEESSAARATGRHHVGVPANWWTIDSYQPGHYRPGIPRTLRDLLARRWAVRNGWTA